METIVLAEFTDRRCRWKAKKDHNNIMSMQVDHPSEELVASIAT
jgi:hypothetical protein